MNDEWIFSEGNYFLDRDGSRYCVAFERVGYGGQFVISRDGIRIGACWPLQAALDWVMQRDNLQNQNPSRF